MAKHRKPRKLNFFAVTVPLFFATLFLLSLFSFSSFGGNPIALPPTQTSPTPTTSAPPEAPTQLVVPTAGLMPNKTTRPANISAASAVPTKTAPGETKTVAPTEAPPLPLPTLPSSKPLLKLDNGVELNVPLLNLGVTVAPLK